MKKKQGAYQKHRDDIKTRSSSTHSQQERGSVDIEQVFSWNEVSESLNPLRHNSIFKQEPREDVRGKNPETIAAWEATT